MSSPSRRYRWVRIVLPAVVFCAVFAVLNDAWATPAKHGKQKKRTAVWAVYFSSTDCPRCEAAKTLIDSLKSKYPLRVRAYNVGDEKGYALFSSMEAIHGANGFSVPLVIVGDSILIGEKDIGEKLEQIVRKLATSGGASLPYLGKQATTGLRPERRCRTCGNGRTPSSGQKQRKLKILIDKVN